MSLFITSPPNTRGAFAVENPPPSMVIATGTQTAVCVGQFPWGPSEVLTYPGTPGSFYNTFAPRGMSRTGSAHLSIIRKGWPVLGAIRAQDPTALPSSGLLKHGVTTLLSVTAKCKGSAGNGIILTTGAAGDGIAAHFSLSAAVSGASGTTVETYDNLNVNNSAGPDVLPILTNSILLGSVTKVAAGTPDPGNVVLAGGTDGATTSVHYVGTPGGGDYGMALLENDESICHVFTDDPGNSIRSAVNNGLLNHVELMTDRVGFINGPAGQTAAAAQLDANSYRSTRIVYVDPWAYVYDDTDGTMRLAPSSCWGASLAAQLPPSAAISWRADRVSAMLDGISMLETDRGGVRGQNTAAGIATLIKRRRGGFTFEADVVTSLTAGDNELTRTRMGQYIARSIVDAWEDNVDGPNILIYQQDMVNSAEGFLGTLKSNKGGNPAFLPYIDDYVISPPDSANPQAALDAGDFTVPVDVKIGSNMHRIFLSMRYGEGVSVQAA